MADLEPEPGPEPAERICCEKPELVFAWRIGMLGDQLFIQIDGVGCQTCNSVFRLERLNGRSPLIGWSDDHKKVRLAVVREPLIQLGSVN